MDQIAKIDMVQDREDGSLSYGNWVEEFTSSGREYRIMINISGYGPYNDMTLTVVDISTDTHTTVIAKSSAGVEGLNTIQLLGPSVDGVIPYLVVSPK